MSSLNNLKSKRISQAVFISNIQTLINESVRFKDARIIDDNDCSRIEIIDQISLVTVYISFWNIDPNYVSIEIENIELFGEHLDSVEQQESFSKELSLLILQGVQKVVTKKTITYEYKSIDSKTGKVFSEKKQV